MEGLYEKDHLSADDARPDEAYGAHETRLLRDQNALADRPVPGRKRPSQMRGDAIYRILYDLWKVRDTRRFEVDF